MLLPILAFLGYPFGTLSTFMLYKGVDKGIDPVGFPVIPVISSKATPRKDAQAKADTNTFLSCQAVS